MDHVHLLVEPLPHTTPSRLVNRLKGVLSRFLRQEFTYVSPKGVPELFHRILWWSTPGYCQRIY